MAKKKGKNSTKKAKNNRVKNSTKSSAKRRTSSKGKRQYNKRYSQRTPKETKQPINIYVVNEKDKDKEKSKEDEKRYERKQEELFQKASGGDTSSDRRSERYERIKRKKDISPKEAKIKRLKSKKGIAHRVVPAKVKVSGGSSGISNLIKMPFMIVLCIVLIASIFLMITNKKGDNVGNWPWQIHECVDKDGDHYCDKIGCDKCFPVDENGDGYCDICNACIHIDENGDCKCDRCDEEYHADENRDNKCDNCGKKGLEPTNIERILKATFDEIGDVFERGFNAIGKACKTTFDAIGDWGKRTWEGFVSVLPDWMYKSDGKSDCVHIDENGNGICDKCFAKYVEREDTTCLHIDEDNNGYCDKCNVSIIGNTTPSVPSACAHIDLDENKHCDLCGVLLEENTEDKPSGVGYTVTFNANGGVLSTAETTRITTADGYLMSAPGAHLAGYKFIGWYTTIDGGELVEISKFVFTSDCTLYARYELACEHIDEDLDEHCDICGVKYYCLHVDEDGDETCDKCGFEIPDEDDTENDSECEHIDGNADKFCDLCGAVMQDGEGGDEPGEPDKPIEPGECEHSDRNDDGVCDNCGTGFEDGCNHRDSDDNGKCDKCEESYSDFCDNHKDRNDDGKCDNCGSSFEDGCDLHRDRNDDGYCDKCDIEYDDGEEPCQHRDGNDDGKCDYCGEDFEDAIEDSVSEISNLSTLYDENEKLSTKLENFTYSYKWGYNGQALEDIGTVSTNGDFKIAILFENEYFRDYFLTDGSPERFETYLDDTGKYLNVSFVFHYADSSCLYDISSITMQTALFDKNKTGNYAKIRDENLVRETNGAYSYIVGGELTVPVGFLTESNNCLIITVKASPRYEMSELVDNSQSGSVTGVGVNVFRPVEFCGFTLDGKMRVYMHTTFDYILTRVQDKDGNVIYEYDERYPFGKVVEIDIVEELQDPLLILTADLVENRKDYGPVYVDDYAQVEDFAYVTVRYNLNGFDIDVHIATVHVPVLDENGDYIYDENGWNEWKCVSLFDFYFDLPEGASGSNITVWNEGNSTSEKYSELMLDIVTSNATWGYILYDYSEASNIVVEIEILAERIQMVLKNEKE